MNSLCLDFDPTWEDLYTNNKHLNKYPFNNVPNFFFRHYPRDKKPAETLVMEVGFGAGNNLWMCAREGFRVCGVDAAPSAVGFARERFKNDGLVGDLRVGDFAKLPFADASVDIAINRQALTQVDFERSKKAVREVHRCLRPGGIFWSNMFSDKTYKDGEYLGRGLWTKITKGRLAGIGQTALHGRDDLLDMYETGWLIKSVEHLEYNETLDGKDEPYCEWMVVSQKI